MRHGRFGVIILKDNYSLADFYRGKRVLLTGHTGFKGTWMSIMLEKLGAEVHILFIVMQKQKLQDTVKEILQTKKL